MCGALLLVAGCTSFTEDERTDPEAAEVTTRAPDEELTVVADADPVAAAVGASRALFASSDVAVLARDGDPAGTLLGASAAVGLGVPLLLEPEDGAADDALAAELQRLEVGAVLAVGAADGEGDAETIAVPAAPDAVAEATGLRFAGSEPVDDDGAIEAVAALDAERPAALQSPDGGDPAPEGEPGRLPEVARAEPLDGVVVLASGSPEALAGVATARAAGARVQLIGGTDPRSSEDAIEALADSAEQVVALGADFADEGGLDWKLATAREGTQLPGGGQTLFPGRMLVALYGSPGSGALGVLGEQDADASVQRARDHAAPYEDLVDRPVVPAFEIIVTVASSAAGPDGNFSTELDPETVRPWVEAASDAGIYVFLDLQPGRTDFLTQAQAYEPLLELPNVGLALDPEWRLEPGQQHLTQIGSVGVDEVNSVITWLADLTRARNLPQKLLVLHQFRLDSLPDRERIDLSRDELAVMIHADGQGSQGDKQATWQALHTAPLPTGPLYWGWKNFYDEDAPMLTPEQTIDQVDPVPDLVTYQ
ncbi:hypothetical protein [Geodermatophilus sp. URMC 64]